MKAPLFASALLAAMAAAAGDATAAAAASPTATAVPDARLHHAGGRGHTYGTTAYWIESAQGLVLIDALMLRSEAEQLVDAMKAAGKPLLGIILTHPHIDHFGGLATLRRHYPEVPVYASEATIAAVRPVHQRALAQGWLKEFGDDYVHAVVVPDHALPREGQLVLADQRFHVRSFGAMEADDNLVVFSETLSAVFPGDAVVAEHIYYVGEGYADGALRGLAEMADAYPRGVMAYPSHGDPAPLHVTIEENAQQIRMMRDAVSVALKSITPEQPVDPQIRAQLIDDIHARLRDHSSYGIPAKVVVALNVDGLLKARAAPEANAVQQ